MAGASAVQLLGRIKLPEVFSRVISGLQKYLEIGLRSIRDIIGLAHSRKS